jgi:hypothetical protein
MKKSLLLLLLAAAAASMKSCHGYQYNASQGPLVTSVIVFGDSIVDPGNNNGLLTLIKANHPPYGKDFIHHQSTGRYSNGLIPSDLIGEHLLHCCTYHYSYSFPSAPPRKASARRSSRDLFHKTKIYNTGRDLHVYVCCME